MGFESRSCRKHMVFFGFSAEPTTGSRIVAETRPSSAPRINFERSKDPSVEVLLPSATLSLRQQSSQESFCRLREHVDSNATIRQAVAMSHSRGGTISLFQQYSLLTLKRDGYQSLSRWSLRWRAPNFGREGRRIDRELPLHQEWDHCRHFFERKPRCNRSHPKVFRLICVKDIATAQLVPVSRGAWKSRLQVSLIGSTIRSLLSQYSTTTHNDNN